MVRVAEHFLHSLFLFFLVLIQFSGSAQAQTATTTTVSSAPNPSSYGQSVMLAAKVLPTSGGGAPTGTVTFANTMTSAVLGTPALSPVTQVNVAAHGDHTCSLDNVGGVTCWGQNYDGQLGDGTFANRLTPVAVTDLSSGVVAVANGLYHSCALTTAGGVRCWGGNVEGQLGDNTTTRRTTPVAVSGLSSGVVAISAGDLHTCALTSAGTVLCWGSNGNGRLGDNSNTRRLTPVAVSGLSSGVIAITTGANNSCAVTSSGAAMCWGKNGNGELGDNSTTDRFTPVTVYGLSNGIVGISAGGAHGCAVSSSGGVSCWGYNAQGQLGDNSTTQRLTPVAVSGLSSGGIAVSTGANHSCALTAGGVVRCWGYNAYGQLGDNSTSNRLTPVSVFGLSGAASMEAGGFHNCVVTSTGALSCWGQNVFGQLGDNSTTQRLTPVATQHPVVDAAVISLSTLDADIHTIEASYSGDVSFSASSGTTSHTVNQSANVITFPALANTSFDDPPPVPAATASSGLTVAYSTTSSACTVSPTGAISFVSAGECSVTASQSGNDNYVAASDVTRSFEVLVGAASQILAINGNNQQAIIGSTFFRRLTATVLDSGNNPVVGVTVTFAAPGSGASGLFGTMTSTTAVTNAFGAATSSNFTANDTIGTYTVTATAAGVTTPTSFTLTNLGRGTTTTVSSAPNPSSYGQLVTLSAKVLSPTGFGTPTGSVTFTNTTTSALIGSPTLTALAQTKLAAGGIHTCSIDSGGGLWCWGVNLNGVLGDGTTTQRNTPVAVSGLSSGVAAVSGGEAHSCAVTSAGAVLCWGSNSSGQIGDSTNTSRSTPTSVQSLSSGVSAVTTGFSHSCALTTAGAVWCWGNNSSGQLGDGSTTDRLTPVAVVGLPNGVAAIEAGSFHTCAVTTAGAVRCWGNNGWGQLGDNSRTSRLTPVGVSSLTSGIAAIGAGGGQTCALSDSGSVSCWGLNGAGQLGDNSTTDRLTPVVVAGLSAGVAAIAVGDDHSCALLSAGTVSCWGYNVAGQLGDNTTTTRLTPVAVVGLLDSVTAIAADGRHNCVIGTSGGVSCWGSNTSGQLGDNSTTNRLTPVATEFPVRQASLQTSALGGGLNTIQASYSGDNTFRASSGTTSHTVNQAANVITFPALPDTSFDDPPPVPAATASSGLTVTYATPTGTVCTVDSAGVIVFVAAGTCSVTASQAGDADHVAAADATQSFEVLPGAPATIAVSAGSGQSTAISTDFGTALSVLVTDSGGNAVSGVTVTFTAPGFGASGSFAGSASTTAVTDASGVATAPAFTANATPGSYSVEVSAAGVTMPASFTLTNSARPTITSLSSAPNPSSLGQFVTLSAKVHSPSGGTPTGSVTFTDTTTSTVLGTSTLAAVTQVKLAAGYDHNCSIDALGVAYCWGSNANGQLGDGTTLNRLAPSQVVSSLSRGTLAVAAGSNHSCALTEAGAVLCWGLNSSGQVGDGTNTQRLAPVAVSGLSTGIAAIASGRFHNCALTDAGGVSCWGSNTEGQLGNNSIASSNVPVAVSGLASGVVAIAAGGYHSCALTSAGAVLCWGANFDGQVGDNSTTNRLTPVAVSGLSSGVSRVSGGFAHSCAMTTAGAAFCWGRNYNGELGDNTTTNRSVPVAVSGLSSNVVTIAAGYEHSCAVTTGGAVSCWGWNGYGQIGDSSTINRLVPVGVSAMSSNIAAVYPGFVHSCALSNAGAVSCWGEGGSGQLGDYSASSSMTPVAASYNEASAAFLATSNLGGGAHYIQAAYNGDASFAASTDANFHNVNQGSNVITFPALSDTIIHDQAPMLAATSSSGLTVTYGTTTSSVCSVSTVGVIAMLSPGVCSVVASQPGNADYVAASDVTQSFEVLPGAPVVVLADSGDIQSTIVGSAFAAPLAARVLDIAGFPVPNVTVTFTAPSSGPGGSFAGSASTTAVTDASGVATASAFTANSSAGSYNVEASAGGVATPASFTLTNNPGAPATIAVSAGSGQSTTVGTDFGTALAVLVTDGGGNAVSGVTVTFTAPSSGASGSFAGSASMTAVTDASGVATAPAFSANATPGSYSVEASAAGVATPASLALTNVSDATTTAVSSAPNPSALGQSVFISSRVTAAPGGGTPTGSVTFTDTTTSTVLGTPTLTALSQTKISSRADHSCSIDSVGGVWCWGNNGYGWLGDGTPGVQLSPVPVSGLVGRAVTVATGHDHSCALTESGAVQCWGWNDRGQLGDGTTTGRLTPVAVIGLPGNVVDINVGGKFSCALTADGVVYCWGFNASGQLGDGTTTDSPTPVAVTGLSGDVVAIATGGAHGCAVSETGAVSCWGLNNFGQLGDGSQIDRLTPVAVDGLSGDVAAIAASYSHTCALTDGGAVSCWGWNQHGQLGNGSLLDSLTPVSVTGLSSGTVAIAAGDRHNCALSDAGAVSCWGFNGAGQVGDGTGVRSLTPVPVAGLSGGIAAIATGAFHSCALGDTGAVSCWGYNVFGQLGDNSTTSRLTPVATQHPEVSAASMSTSSLGGGTHTIEAFYSGDAVFDASTGTTSHTVNQAANVITFPALPDTSFDDPPPVPAATASSGLTVAYSTTTGTICSVDSAGVIAFVTAGTCSVTASQAGNADHVTAADVTQSFEVLPGAPATIAVSAGSGQSTTVGTEFGTALAVLVTDSGGNAVSGVTVTFTAPGSGASGSFAGSASTTAVTDASGVATASAFTANSSAGSYSVEASVGGVATPVSFTLTNNAGAPSQIAALAGSGQSTSVGTAFGASLSVTVRDIGSNPVAGVTVTFSAPGSGASGVFTGGSNVVTAVTDASGIAASSTFTANSTAGAYTVVGTVTGVGTPASFSLTNTMAATITTVSSAPNPSTFGQVVNIAAKVAAPPGLGAPTGTVTITDTATSTALGTTALGPMQQTTVAGGGYHSCSIDRDGGVSCWGHNHAGQLGDGSTSDRWVPVPVTGLSSGVVSVSGGLSHSCALTGAGAVWCWGQNSFGQLGDGTTNSSLTPVPVLGLSTGVVAISSGDAHSCALTDTASIVCWGYNTFGQLGDNSSTNRLTPVPVAGLTSGVAEIAAGGQHTCALSDAGAVLCWGNNLSGQLGDNSTTSRSTPVPASNLASGVAAISGGRYHTCAVTLAGAALCWGDNFAGQLGDNSTDSRLTPVPVSGLSSGVASIAAGEQASCAVSSMGAVSCWGGNGGGQLGNGTTTDSLTPVPVSSLSTGVSTIATGSNHSCALTSAGAISCWGHNNNGALGDNSISDRSNPVITQFPATLASLQTTALGGGVRMLQATYSGDSNFAASSGTVTHTVNRGSNVITFPPLPNTARAAAPPVPLATASSGLAVTYSSSTTTVCTVSIAGQISFVTAGTCSITARQAGNSNYVAAANVTRSFQVIAGTTTTLATTGSPVTFGTPVTFSATVAAPGAAMPTGSVTFRNSGATIGTAALVNGVARFTTASLAVGSHAISAAYGGSAMHAAGLSGTVTQTVNKAASVTTLAVSPASPLAGQSVTLTAAVAASPVQAGAPAGRVVFRDGTTVLGSANVAGGNASFSTAALAPGGHSLTASYEGSGALTGSNSQPRLLTVKLSCVNAFAGATGLTGASGTALGSTVGATGENGEPRHGGDTGPINSVWCRWTAPSSGEVVFDTLGSLYDTTLAVYTGAPVWQLTSIAGNDNISPDTKQSRVRFAATQGTAYIIVIDGAGAATGDYVLNWAAAPSAPTLLAAVLPTSRSVQLGSTATAFATIINSGGALARQCRLALPAGFPGVLTYQATTAANALTGQPNTPVDIEPGARQSFVFAITPTTVLNTADIGLTFTCQNTAPAQSVPGVNTLALSVAVQPVPDVLAIASTITGDGIVTLPLGGTTPLTAAAINIGAAGYLTASVDDGGMNLPVVVTLCRSDPATGACMGGTALVPAQRFLLANGEVATLTIQIRSTGPVAFSPGVNRLNLRLRTDDGVTRGSTGVAVRTQ